MGKALITQNLGGGKYKVIPQRNRARVDAEITSLMALLDELQPQIAEAQVNLGLRQQELDEAIMLLQAILKEWAAGAFDPPDLSDLILRHNIVRSSNGLPALQTSTALHEAALRHAKDIRGHDRGGHAGSDGSTPIRRITAAGFPISPIIGGGGGENVAAGYITNAAVIAGWMGSEGHRANILSEEWTHIGAAYASRGDGNHRTFWVVTFGLPGGGQSVPGGPPPPPDLGAPGDAVDIPDALLSARMEAIAAARNRDIARLALAQIEARDLEVRQRVQMLASIPADNVPQDAWCADYSTTLTGEVGSIEVPGEGIERLWIRPGYEGAEHVPERDGQMHHRAGLVSYHAYLLAAMLPGWQRWMPQYRVGTIASIDTEINSCIVEVDSEESSAARLLIDRPDGLNIIPAIFRYMECGHEAFAVGDRVIIEFPGRDWNNARVIGFESNPVQCIPWPSAVFMKFRPQFGGGVEGSPLPAFRRLRAVRSDLADPCSCFPTLRWDPGFLGAYLEGGYWLTQYVFNKRDLLNPTINNIYYDTPMPFRFDMDITSEFFLLKEEVQRSPYLAYGRSGDGKERNIFGINSTFVYIEEKTYNQPVMQTYSKYVSDFEEDCQPLGENESAYVAQWLTGIADGGCTQQYPALPAPLIIENTFESSDPAEIGQMFGGEFAIPEFLYFKDSVTGQTRRYRHTGEIDRREFVWGALYEDDPI